MKLRRSRHPLISTIKTSCCALLVGFSLGFATFSSSPAVAPEGQYQCRIVKKTGSDSLKKLLPVSGKFSLTLAKRSSGSGYVLKRPNISAEAVVDIKSSQGVTSFNSFRGLETKDRKCSATVSSSFTWKETDGKVEYTENLSVINPTCAALNYNGLATFTALCERVYRKAVFIRPCPLLKIQNPPPVLFSDTSFRKTVVGGGNVSSVCLDLKDSGVTDIFLPFKVDHEGKGCGNYGELLYPSKEFPNNISSVFKGKDPIKSIIESCSGMKIHGWFPVFKDQKAIEVAGGAENAGMKARKNGIWDQATDFWDSITGGKQQYDYRSDKFADPSNPEIVDYQIKLLREIVALYPQIGGINLDYIRYSGADNPSTKENENEDPKAPIDSVWIVDSKAVEEFVRKVREEFPNIELSADVFSSGSARSSLGQEGMITYLNLVILMQYTYMGSTDSNIVYPQEEITKWLRETQSLYPQVPRISLLRGWISEISDPRGNSVLTTLRLDIEEAKRNNIAGYGIFTYESFLYEGTQGKKRLKDVKGELNF